MSGQEVSQKEKEENRVHKVEKKVRHNSRSDGWEKITQTLRTIGHVMKFSVLISRKKSFSKYIFLKFMLIFSFFQFSLL